MGARAERLAAGEPARGGALRAVGDIGSHWLDLAQFVTGSRIAGVAGALPAAVAAGGMGLGLICPEASGAEAAWAGDTRILIAKGELTRNRPFRSPHHSATMAALTGGRRSHQARGGFPGP